MGRPQSARHGARTQKARLLHLLPRHARAAFQARLSQVSTEAAPRVGGWLVCIRTRTSKGAPSALPGSSAVRLVRFCQPRRARMATWAHGRWCCPKLARPLPTPKTTKMTGGGMHNLITERTPAAPWWCRNAGVVRACLFSAFSRCSSTSETHVLTKGKSFYEREKEERREKG